MSKLYVAVVLFTLILSNMMDRVAFAQTAFWLTDGSVGTSRSPSVSTVEALVGVPKEIHLWAQPSGTLQNFSLNLISDSETVLEFDRVVVHNDAGDGDSRFEFVFDSDNGLEVESGFCDFEAIDFDNIPSHAIWDIRGFTFDGDSAVGIPASENGVLLATISLTGLTLGDADIFLQIGEIGISNKGETTFESSVLFGSEPDPLLNAELNRCVNSASSDATISVVAELSRVAVIGDFNEDGLVDAADMDLLSTEVRAGTHDTLYDVTGDGLVDAADREFWVEDIKGTIFGDSNFDREVEFVDFLTLNASFGQPGGWASGDFDGTANVDFPDFLILSAAFGTKATAESASVPEPSAGVLALGLCCLLSVGRSYSRPTQRPQ